MEEEFDDARDDNVEEEGAEDGQRLPRVVLAPHPLGGITVGVRTHEGEIVTTRIDLPEATLLVSHLTALNTMAFSTIYQQVKEQSPSGLIIPGRN